MCDICRNCNMEKNEGSVSDERIDIYSRTVVTDWNAIKYGGVEVVYIKLTMMLPTITQRLCMTWEKLTGFKVKDIFNIVLVIQQMACFLIIQREMFKTVK